MPRRTSRGSSPRISSTHRSSRLQRRARGSGGWPPPPTAGLPMSRSASAWRAWRTPVGSGVDSGEGEEAGGGGGQGRVGGVGPGEEVARGAVEGDGARLHRDDPVGGGEAALETMFGEEDGHPPLLVETAQEPDQLVAGDGVQLRRRLVEEDQAGTGDQGGGEGHALELAAGEGVDGAVEEVWDRQGQGDLLDGAGAGGGVVSPHLQRQLDLGGDGGRDDLGLGILGDVADDRRQLSRPRLDRVEVGDGDGAFDLTAVEVRDEAAGGFEQGRLAGGGAAGEEDELAWCDLQGDAGEGGARGSRVGVAQTPRSRGRARRRGGSPAQTRPTLRAEAGAGERRLGLRRSGASPLSTRRAERAKVVGSRPSWIVG